MVVEPTPVNDAPSSKKEVHEKNTIGTTHQVYNVSESDSSSSNNKSKAEVNQEDLLSNKISPFQKKPKSQLLSDNEKSCSLMTITSEGNSNQVSIEKKKPSKKQSPIKRMKIILEHPKPEPEGPLQKPSIKKQNPFSNLIDSFNENQELHEGFSEEGNPRNNESLSLSTSNIFKQSLPDQPENNYGDLSGINLLKEYANIFTNQPPQSTPKEKEPESDDIFDFLRQTKTKKEIQDEHDLAAKAYDMYIKELKETGQYEYYREAIEDNHLTLDDPVGEGEEYYDIPDYSEMEINLRISGLDFMDL